MITRKISAVRALVYFLAQLFGATLGSSFVYAVRRAGACLEGRQIQDG